jgi:hypothetical protein
MQHPDVYLAVDECKVAYAGRYCSFKQYIPSKPCRCGIKVWALCCLETKYMYNFEIYSGASVIRHEGRMMEEPTERATVNPGSKYGVVSRLTTSLDDQWHCIAMDNFFSSPRLFEDMYHHGFYCIGIARPNRRGFPSSLNYRNNQPHGTLHVRVHRDENMAAVHWTDCKGVHLLTTKCDPIEPSLHVNCHVGQDIIHVRTSPMQVLYTTKMRGIDINNQLRTHCTCTIATKKWWQCLLFFCIDVSLTKSFIVYREMCIRKQQRTQSHRDFLHVVESDWSSRRSWSWN